MRDARRFQLACLLIFVFVVSTSCLAQGAGENALTNTDIVKMMKAGIPENIILREIEMSPGSFGTGPAALIELKKHGASERILGAILDSRNGGSRSTFEPDTAPYTSVPSIAQGPHHLPSFEADLQVKSKTHNKISVGQNHIEVKQGRTPLFSLTWKEKPQDK